MDGIDILFEYEMIHKLNKASFDEVHHVTHDWLDNHPNLQKHMHIWFLSDDELLNMFKLIEHSVPKTHQTEEERMRHEVLLMSIQEMRQDPPREDNNVPFSVLDISVCIRPDRYRHSGLYKVSTQ